MTQAQRSDASLVLQQGLISPLLLGEQAGLSPIKLGSASAPLLADSNRSPSLKNLALAG